MAIKKIPIQQLRVGMYFAGSDLPWISTPFWRRSFLIRSASDIVKLRQYGALEVDIDTARGIDVKELPPPASQAIEQAPKKSEPPPAELSTALGKELSQARKARQELLTSVQSVFDNVAAGVVQADQVRNVAHRVVSTTLAQPAAFMALSRARKFDPGLQEHSLSVCTLALFLGQAVKCGPGRLEDLAHGALLHDVGLLRLPHYMLRLSRRLSGHEQILYDSHPRLGAELLQREGGFHRDIIEIVAEHHATLDAFRTKRAVSYRPPSEAAQIVGIVDRYVDLTTPQFDGPGLTGAGALSHLYQEAQAGRLDVGLVSRFIQVLGVYPLYSLVRLNTGECGIVTKVSPGNVHKPVVMLARNAAGERYEAPLYIDLAEDSTHSITEVLDEEKEGIKIEEALTEATELPAPEVPA
jgi:putative nucleotidyltransferase with HDIG domain